jgi:hypothetical protein
MGIKLKYDQPIASHLILTLTLENKREKKGREKGGRKVWRRVRRAQTLLLYPSMFVSSNSGARWSITAEE